MVDNMIQKALDNVKQIEQVEETQEVPEEIITKKAVVEDVVEPVCVEKQPEEIL